jgi:hypothetical protein
MVQPREAPRPRRSSGPRWRACARAAAVGVALALAGCGGSEAVGTSTPVSPTPGASVVAAPTTMPPFAGSFAELPFTLDLPQGWIFGTQQQIEANLRSWGYGKLLAQVQEDRPPITGGFVAYDIRGGDAVSANVSCNMLDRGITPPADALNLGETQNVEALGRLPGIVGRPSADRVLLPAGETVRIRWRNTSPATDTSSIGYMFVVGPTIYTCVFTAATSTVATQEPEWESILGTFQAKAPTAAGPSPSTSASACPMGGPPHQAPEIEAMLPGIVDGRALSRWSVRGECWLELVIDPGARGEIISWATTPANPDPVDPLQLVYGVAGRSAPTEPPYFVFAALRPPQDDANLPLLLLLGGAGYRDIEAGMDLRNYQERTISGKRVHVGTPTMINQDRHQRGRPYLYQTETHMFLVLTDNDAWATDAIAQLP